MDINHYASSQLYGRRKNYIAEICAGLLPFRTKTPKKEEDWGWITHKQASWNNVHIFVAALFFLAKGISPLTRSHVVVHRTYVTFWCYAGPKYTWATVSPGTCMFWRQKRMQAQDRVYFLTLKVPLHMVLCLRTKSAVICAQAVAAARMPGKHASKQSSMERICDLEWSHIRAVPHRTHSLDKRQLLYKP